MSNEEEEPRIIVDEDWKSRVEKEKAAADSQDEAGKDKQDAQKDKEEEETTPFMQLVSYLGMHGAGAMGILADPNAETITVDLDTGRFIVDLLMTLREKTKGNISPAEDADLRSMLAKLQRTYVEVAQIVQQSEMDQSDSGGDAGSGEDIIV